MSRSAAAPCRRCGSSSANPFLLNKYGVAMEDIRAAIQSANANSPKGALEGNGQRYQIYTNGRGPQGRRLCATCRSPGVTARASSCRTSLR
jgi:hypothetical protein